MVADSVEDPRVVADQIKYWLDYSEIFYDAFKFEKYLGPNWFVVHELLAGPDITTFSAFLSTIQKIGITRSNPGHDVSEFLDHLRELKHIALIDPEITDTKGNKIAIELHEKLRVFPARTEIQILDKLKKAGAKFTHELTEGLLGRQKADEMQPEWPKQFESAYRFMRKSFIPKWENLLENLALESVSGTHMSATTISNQLKKNTEVFVILFKLWLARLKGEDAEGFDVEKLHDMSLRVRKVALVAVRNCMSMLERCNLVSLVNDIEPKKYRLNERYDGLFDKFACDLLPLKSMLRECLRPMVKI